MNIEHFVSVLTACCMSLTMAAQGRLDSVQHVREIVVVSKPAMREVVPSQKLNGEMLEQLNTHSVAPAVCTVIVSRSVASSILAAARGMVKSLLRFISV